MTDLQEASRRHANAAVAQTNNFSAAAAARQAASQQEQRIESYAPLTEEERLRADLERAQKALDDYLGPDVLTVEDVVTSEDVETVVPA
jgi:hypothetical protein